MAEIKKWSLAEMKIPDGCNIIVGQSHFIKTVEDLFEALATSGPALKFGIAFCEASGDRLIRRDGNSEDLTELAVENAKKIASGHSFVIMLKDGFPVNVLDRIKACQEVCRIFAATANPLQIIVAETDQGRGVAGAVDGFTPLGVENDDDVSARKALLREVIGYKR